MKKLLKKVLEKNTFKTQDIIRLINCIEKEYGEFMANNAVGILLGAELTAKDINTKELTEELSCTEGISVNDITIVDIIINNLGKTITVKYKTSPESETVNRYTSYNLSHYAKG